MTVKEIKKSISELSPEDLSILRSWLERFERQREISSCFGKIHFDKDHDYKKARKRSK